MSFICKMENKGMALCQMFYFSPLELEIVMGTLSMECELNRADRKSVV